MLRTLASPLQVVQVKEDTLLDEVDKLLAEVDKLLAAEDMLALLAVKVGNKLLVGGSPASFLIIINFQILISILSMNPYVS